MGLGLKSKFERARLAFRLRWLTTKYLVDKPKLLYQPLPWCGIETAKRDNGCRQRLEMILRGMGEAKGSVLDVGSAVGFFSISLAERGCYVTGIEVNRRKFEIAQCVAAIAKVQPVSFVNLKLTAETINLLPTYDFTLCLSIWHHWVRYFGFDEAMLILESLWDRTKDRMFFETGLDELPAYFNMPEV